MITIDLGNYDEAEKAISKNLDRRCYRNAERLYRVKSNITGNYSKKRKGEQHPNK